MIHEIEDIERELHRLSQRPPHEGAPPVLCAFDVVTSGPIEDYAVRIRSVLDSALELAVSELFDGDDLPIDGVPGWFADVSGEPSATPPDFARRGMERYFATVKGGKGGGWKLQEWLYQFDPDSEFRGWAWWDLTQSGHQRARIWVDTWGESFFACDELRWLAYTSGGNEVSGPALLRINDWVSATTL